MRFKFKIWLVICPMLVFCLGNCSKRYIKNYNAGIDAYDRTDYTNSIDYFQKSQVQKPEWAESYYGLGLAYYKLSKYEEAEAQFMKGLKISPDNPQYLWGLGLTYYQMGNKDMAVVSFKRSFELQPTEDCAYNLAIVLREMGNFQEAKQQFLLLRVKNPKSIEILQNLALCYQGTGEINQAVATWQQVLSLVTDPQKKQQIQAYIAAAHEKKIPDLATKDRPLSRELAPSVIIYAPANNAQVFDETVKLTAKAFSEAGINTVNLYVNGKKFETKRGMAIVTQDEGKPVHLMDTHIPLLPGANELVVEAVDVSGNSVKETIEVIRFKPKLFGLFVGISRYQDQRIPQLSYADRDATALYQLFSQQKTFETTQLRLLQNEDATRSKITESLAYFLSKAAPHDLVIIFLAAHGMLEAGEYFFIPHDAMKDNLFGTAIKDIDIGSSLKRISSKRVLLFTDTCHSAGLKDGLEKYRGSESPVSRFFETLSKAEGRITITASESNEVSIEDARLKHGVFSYHLLQGLRGKADKNQDQVVGVMELFQYLSEQVPDVTRGGQHPVLLIPEGKLAGDVPLLILEK